jgi:tetratricopeptide (TPR) repeat protein
MANQDYADHLARAWSLHRQGQHDAAVHEFQSLLELSRNNMDALYGLGLAQRSTGQIEAAHETFEKCLEHIDAALREQPGEDRYEMLEKMIKQRLAELKGGKN